MSRASPAIAFDVMADQSTSRSFAQWPRDARRHAAEGPTSLTRTWPAHTSQTPIYAALTSKAPTCAEPTCAARPAHRVTPACPRVAHLTLTSALATLGSVG